MRTLIFTYYLDNYYEISKIASENRREYCAAHGYEYLMMSGGCKKYQSYDFERLEIVKSLLSNYDRIFVLNVSHMIMNMNISIDNIGLFPETNYAICRDVNGLNEGSSIFLNSEWTKKWINFLLDLEPKYRNDCWTLQRAIMHHHELPEWKEKIQIYNDQFFNKYFYTLYNFPATHIGHFNKGDFVLGLPGLSYDQRLEILRDPNFKNNILQKT